ncbi:MAG: CocE/NonD family hydrolase [Acidimicrobiales bacterium]
MRISRIAAGAAALLSVPALSAVAPLGGQARAATPSYTKTTRTFPVVVGPHDDQHCTVLGDLYVPNSATPASPVPAILTTNGFGGSKDDQADLGAYAASHGYEVLSYSGLGFGGSGCNIELDDPDWDGKAASQLITFLGQRPEVVKDHPGDPRVGMIGGSYGGGIQLSTASIDPRLDAIVPIITWNDLSYSLAPNNDSAAFKYQNSPPGVPKMEWTELFFALGISEPLQHSSATPVPPSTCPGFDPRVCQANVDTAARGYPSPSTIALLRHASAAAFIDRIKIPTLLMQGEADSLFTLADAVANYEGIKANGAPVKLVLQSWGHSHAAPVAGEFSQADPASTYEGRLVLAWFDRYLKNLPVATGPEVEYFRDWAYNPPAAPDNGAAAQAAYAGAPAWPVGNFQTLQLSGADQLVSSGTPSPVHSVAINPPGGLPASYSETSAVQDQDPFTRIPPTDPPGETAGFSTGVLTHDVDLAGIPTLDVSVTAAVPPGVDPAADVSLFAKLYDVAPDGSVTLVNRLVSPVRVADASHPVHINLPGIVHRYPLGHRIRLVLSTTDSAYVGSRIPNAVSFGSGQLHLPLVDGTRVAP